jgi:hypothetical protein
VDPAGRPDPSPGSGFTSFLYVAIGAAVLALALGVVGLGVLASDPRSGEMLSAAGRFFSATVEGQFTPAAEALRDAGCQQAFVIPAGDARDFVDALGGDADADLDEGTFVQCRTILPTGDDACATMARVAAGASDPVPAQLIVNVEGFGACRGLYAADGTLIRPLDP